MPSGGTSEAVWALVLMSAYVSRHVTGGHVGGLSAARAGRAGPVLRAVLVVADAA